MIEEPFNGSDGQPLVDTPPEIRAAVTAVERARRAETWLVVVVAVVVLGVVGTTAWNTYRLRNLTHQNVKAQDFGLKAISCILDNFAEHRWSNQQFHDELGKFLHAPMTPHTPLPNLPTDEKFAEDCAPFNTLNTIVVSSSTTTTMGVRP